MVPNQNKESKSPETSKWIGKEVIENIEMVVFKLDSSCDGISAATCWWCMSAGHVQTQI